MVVALSAPHRAGHPDLREIAHAVGQINRSIFAVLSTALVRRLEHAVVASRYELPHRGIGQQVAGELLERKLIEGQIVVEALDDVIAVWRDAMILVAVVTDGV